VSGTHLDFIDREKKVLWISYDGRGDELEANLRAYGVYYVPGFRNGRVGIEFARPCLEAQGHASKLTEAAVTIVSILTMRSGVTKQMEEDFICSLQIVQEHRWGTLEEAAS
jgi:hypothetical protein